MSYYFYKNNYESSNLEITDREITNTYQRQKFYPSYPRHMASVSIRSHQTGRHITNSNRLLPNTCHLVKSQPKVEKETNIALEVLKYQLNDQKAKQTHFNNVRRSLEQRLQAAKISGNYHLVALLQKEFQQLACDWDDPRCKARRT